MDQPTHQAQEPQRTAGLLSKVFRFPLTLLILEVAIIGATATLTSMALHRLGATGSVLVRWV
jgi:hypothetical protein